MSRNVNIAVIGTGGMARTMADTIRKVHHAKLYAVVSRNQDRARMFAREVHAKKAFGSIDEMLADKKVQLVYIAVPHSAHYAAAKKCLMAGKACLVEKPFTVNAKQAEELVSIARQNHVFLAEAIWTRYMPFVKTMQEVLSSKIIGEPVQLNANLSYNNRALPRMSDPALAGGALLDLGVYPLNFASMLFGDDVIRINASCSYTNQHLDEQDNISLIYRDGKTANLVSSMIGISDKRGEIVGTNGYIVVDNINNFRSMTVYDAEGKKVRFYKAPRQYTGYEYEVEEAVAAIQGDQTESTSMPLSETLRMMHMLDFIRSEMGIVYPFEKEEPEAEEEKAPTRASAQTAEDDGADHFSAPTPEEAKPETEKNEEEQALQAAAEEAVLNQTIQQTIEDGQQAPEPDADPSMDGTVLSSPDEDIRVDNESE